MVEEPEENIEDFEEGYNMQHTNKQLEVKMPVNHRHEETYYSGIEYFIETKTTGYDKKCIFSSVFTFILDHFKLCLYKYYLHFLKYSFNIYFFSVSILFFFNHFNSFNHFTLFLEVTNIRYR